MWRFDGNFPFGADEAHRMLSELRLGAMLDGVRGQPSADRHSIARMLSGLSAWASAMQTVLRELDLNPVILNEDGPLAVDCVMVFERLP